MNVHLHHLTNCSRLDVVGLDSLGFSAFGSVTSNLIQKEVLCNQMNYQIAWSDFAKRFRRIRL